MTRAMLPRFTPGLRRTHPDAPALWSLVAPTGLLVRVEDGAARQMIDAWLHEPLPGARSR
jgi:hypothetical protein